MHFPDKVCTHAFERNLLCGAVLLHVSLRAGMTLSAFRESWHALSTALLTTHSTYLYASSESYS